jgi:hypothetical protein
LRESEIVPAPGDSQATSSVLCCVTSIEGTTVFCTPVPVVVHAKADGAAASVVRMTSVDTAPRTGRNDASGRAAAQGPFHVSFTGCLAA